MDEQRLNALRQGAENAGGEYVSIRREDLLWLLDLTSKERLKNENLQGQFGPDVDDRD